MFCIKCPFYHGRLVSKGEDTFEYVHSCKAGISLEGMEGIVTWADLFDIFSIAQEVEKEYEEKKAKLDEELLNEVCE